MKESEVINAIDSEIDFQDFLMTSQIQKGIREAPTMGELLLMMQTNMDRAKESWYTDSESVSYQSTMEYIRKICAIGHRMGMMFGMPERDFIIMDDVTNASEQQIKKVATWLLDNVDTPAWSRVITMLEANGIEVLTTDEHVYWNGVLVV